MLNPITMIRETLEDLWTKLTLNRWTDGFELGMTLGEQKAWRAALRTVQIKAADIDAFQDSAKNKTTKAATDGMELGYRMALDAIREEISRQGIITLPEESYGYDKGFKDAD